MLGRLLPRLAGDFLLWFLVVGLRLVDGLGGFIPGKAEVALATRRVVYLD